MEAANVFHPLTYRNKFDIDSFDDSVLKLAAIGLSHTKLFFLPCVSFCLFFFKFTFC